MRVKSNEKKNEFEKKRARLRRSCNELFYKEGLRKQAVRERLGVSRDFVTSWTRMPDMDYEADARGWPKGYGRRWSEEAVERLLQVHDRLANDPNEFFLGATAVRQEWLALFDDPRFPCARLASC